MTLQLVERSQFEVARERLLSMRTQPCAQCGRVVIARSLTRGGRCLPCGQLRDRGIGPKRTEQRLHLERMAILRAQKWPAPVVSLPVGGVSPEAEIIARELTALEARASLLADVLDLAEQIEARSEAAE